MAASRRTSPPWSGAVRHLNERLERLSHRVTDWVGSSWSFAIAATLILVWAASGPIFNYSETWQLIINTGTTIITFLMVFLIQRSQNKESLAVEIKLNELLAAQQGASNELINAEDMSEEEILNLHKEFSALSQQLRSAADEGSSHSIAEARRAIRRMHQSLGGTSGKRSRKRRPTKGKPSPGS